MKIRTVEEYQKIIEDKIDLEILQSPNSSDRMLKLKEQAAKMAEITLREALLRVEFDNINKELHNIGGHDAWLLVIFARVIWAEPRTTPNQNQVE